MKADTSFVIRGKVGKGLRRKNGEGWTMTNFLVGVYRGKDEAGARAMYDNIPVTAWYDCPVQEGDEVVCTGTIRMAKKQNSRYFDIQLIADDRNGVSIVPRGTSIGREQEVPEMPDLREPSAQDSQEDADFYADDSIPF